MNTLKFPNHCILCAYNCTVSTGSLRRVLATWCDEESSRHITQQTTQVSYPFLNTMHYIFSQFGFLRREIKLPFNGLNYGQQNREPPEKKNPQIFGNLEKIVSAEQKHKTTKHTDGGGREFLSLLTG